MERERSFADGSCDEEPFVRYSAVLGGLETKVTK
jgi:hypothetical protein